MKSQQKDDVSYENTDIYRGPEQDSSTMANGITQLSAAHAYGRLFEQAIGQQQTDFSRNLANMNQQVHALLQPKSSAPDRLSSQVEANVLWAEAELEVRAELLDWRYTDEITTL